MNGNGHTLVSDSLSRNSHCIIMDESPIDSAVRNGLPRCAVSKRGSEKTLLRRGKKKWWCLPVDRISLHRRRHWCKISETHKAITSLSTHECRSDQIGDQTRVSEHFLERDIHYLERDARMVLSLMEMSKEGQLMS